MWEFWRRYRRKAYVTLGVLGSGYFLYKLYDRHRRKLSDLHTELEQERRSDELIKFLVKAHFENVQRIADSTTLPHVVRCLRSQIERKLDLTHLTERLMKGKDLPNSLTAAQKLELWDRLKILSFTRMVLSLWAATLLSLYIRVQVNILGRHIYIDTARGIGGYGQFDEVDLIDRNDQQQFLASADYLSSFGLPTLISSFEGATSEVLEGKQLKDFFNTTVLHDSVIQILNTFMSMGSPHHWLSFLMPEDSKPNNLGVTSSTGSTDLCNASKFEQLMLEARAVFSSTEFRNIVDTLLKAAVDVLMEDISVLCGDANLTSGMPLAKLLPRIAHMDQILLEEPNRNRYIQVIQDIPEIEIFFTLLYASTAAS
ncbi:peroxisome biogenesis protein 3-2-like [Solanum pennellii]|uniref:Peroxisome biogenesis protein 3-2-like n=1 Tax=Solanum pennellii TaxID=28526 RepID=A0ABM1FNW2_SOLPN|nr:peroxisome biogenesis protein 3-2-like [Solanum pennellii]